MVARFFTSPSDTSRKLPFDDKSFSNVPINYKRFKPDKIHYINIYQYEEKTEISNPIYFYKEMRWLKLPSTGFNGSDTQSDFLSFFRVENEISSTIYLTDRFVQRVIRCPCYTRTICLKI